MKPRNVSPPTTDTTETGAHADRARAPEDRTGTRDRARSGPGNIETEGDSITPDGDREHIGEEGEPLVPGDDERAITSQTRDR